MEEYFINLTTKSPFRNSQGLLVSSLSALSSALENFFQKKYAHAETLVIQMLPLVVYTIHPPHSPIYGPKLPKRWVFSTTILYRHNKPAAELAANSKYFSGSNYHTLEAINPKSTATLSTIAATFYSIIIEQIFTTPTKPYKKIHILFIFLEILTTFSSLL